MLTWLKSLPLVLLAIVSALALYLYVQNTSLEEDVLKQTTKIERLEDDLSKEKNRADTLKKMYQSLDDTIIEMRDSIDKVDNTKKEALNQLDAIKNKGSADETHEQTKKNYTTSSTPLDPDIARVLDDLCSQIRGSPCPNP